jgi:hypothetical protein
MSRTPRRGHAPEIGPERHRSVARPRAGEGRRSFWMLSLVSAGFLACSGGAKDSPGTAHDAPLDSSGEQVARCGNEVISRAAVAGVASARQVTPRESVQLLLGDACLAEGAKRRGLPSASVRAVEERRVLSRALLGELGQSDAVTAPVRDDELAAIRAQRWRELDHDAAARVVHAVAMFPEKGPRDPEPLRALMGRVARAVQGASDAADFRQRAQAVVADDPLKKQLRVETLEPVVADGRVLVGEAATYEKAFAEAACRLQTAHEISPVVETSFGFHVLMLLELIPPVHLPDARLRELATPEIRANRGRAALTTLLQRLHGDTPTPVVRDADDLLSKVRFGSVELAATPAERPPGP